jgi:hypothetical protein
VTIGTGSRVDLAVDAADVAHVVYLGDYFADGHEDIIYKKGSGGVFPGPIKIWNSSYDADRRSASYFSAPVIALDPSGNPLMGYKLKWVDESEGSDAWGTRIHVYRFVIDDDAGSTDAYRGEYPEPRNNGIVASSSVTAYIAYGAKVAQASGPVGSPTWLEADLPAGSSHTLAFSATGLASGFVDATGGIAYAENAGAGFGTPVVLDPTASGRNPVVVGGSTPFVFYEAVDSGDHEVWLARATNQAPVLDPVGNQTVDEGSLLSFTLSATDDDGDPLTYSASNLPSGATLDEVTGAFSWTPGYDDAGEHADVVLEVSDGRESDSETITITVNDANVPPVLDAIGNRSVDEGAELSFAVAGSDYDSDPLAYSATGLPAGANFDAGTGAFSWTPGYDQAGTYTGVRFSVTDGTATDSETITITVGDVTPNVLSIGDAERVEGSSGTVAAILTVTLSPVAATTVTVDWATVAGTATAGGDFEAGSGQLTFLAGETSKTIAVNIAGDTQIETDEAFTVGLSNPVNAVLGDEVGVASILNDDSATQAPPFGSVDTPTQNATGIEGAVPVTGWALDDTGVMRVIVSRDPVAGEPAGSPIYVGDAVFVDGARPDVAALHPSYPNASRAGWGYMLLTNMLPNQGNGTFKLWLHAFDREGRQTLLGTRTFTCANRAATRPFGTLDTPGQGAVASGSAYVVFGWALTPQPGAIPTDGSTIWVYVDGVPVGHPVYNQYRSDIATLFPGYANSNGAVGYYVLDTTKLANGVHTIAWSVTDDLGRVEGIGSRYFRVANVEE